MPVRKAHFAWGSVSPKRGMLLVIDNYDSFTFNVVRYLRELGAEVEVRRNDEIDLEGIRQLAPQGLVISPGPCTPNEAGVSLAAIRQFADQLPVLGVCLGHQAIGQVFGAKVVRAEQVMHGKTSELSHTGGGLFEGLPKHFQVARYHSLLLESTTLPECLSVDAWVDEHGQRQIMAVSHHELPVHGIQFHPEAVLSEQGHNLFNNFLTRYRLI